MTLDLEQGTSHNPYRSPGVAAERERDKILPSNNSPSRRQLRTVAVLLSAAAVISITLAVLGVTVMIMAMFGQIDEHIRSNPMTFERWRTYSVILSIGLLVNIVLNLIPLWAGRLMLCERAYRKTTVLTCLSILVGFCSLGGLGVLAQVPAAICALIVLRKPPVRALFEDRDIVRSKS